MAKQEEPDGLAQVLQPVQALVFELELRIQLRLSQSHRVLAYEDEPTVPRVAYSGSPVHLGAIVVMIAISGLAGVEAHAGADTADLPHRFLRFAVHRPVL